MNHSVIQLCKEPFVTPVTRPLTKTAVAPATCGELIQGTIGKDDFLINFPISLFAQVSVSLHPRPGVNVKSEGIFSKVSESLESLLLRLGLENTGLEIDIRSRIPRGKGLASSTSEITAALRAALTLLKLEMPAEDLNRLIVAIDPSDAVIIPGIAMCNPVTGMIYEKFGAPPPLTAIIVDTGGAVDSKTFDRARARANSIKHEALLRYAVQRARQGFETGSVAALAEGATLSARIHQNVLPKEGLEDLLAATSEKGALGINCAHTGTVLGVLFDPLRTDPTPLLECIEKLVGFENIVGTFDMVSGGSYEIPG